MLKFLNKYGEEIEQIEVIEAVWTRKYHSVGEFCIYLSANYYKKEIKYIQNIGRPETGIVQKVVFEKKINGDFITLSGFFIDKMLDGACITKAQEFKGATNKSATMEALRIILMQSIRQYSNNLWRTIAPGSRPSIEKDPYMGALLYESLLDEESDLPSNINFELIPGDKLGESLLRILEDKGYTYTCTPSFNPSGRDRENIEPLLGLKLKFWQGRDLREKIFFSPAFNSASKIEFMTDESKISTKVIAIQLLPDNVDYSNFTWIWKDGKAQRAIFETYTYPSNTISEMGKTEPSKVIFTQATDIEAGNEAKVRQQMREFAKLELLNNYKIENISVDVVQERFIYGTDYDLGDICTIIVDEIKESFVARIIEIVEVYRENKVDVQIILGTPRKQIYRKVLV